MSLEGFQTNDRDWSVTYVFYETPDGGGNCAEKWQMLNYILYKVT